MRVQDAALALLEVVRPVDPSGDDVAAAARLKWGDFEDCLVAVSAGKANADYIITRDRKGFERSMVPAVTPDEWLRLICENRGIAFDAVGLDRPREACFI